jgi:hypothetical protein
MTGIAILHFFQFVANNGDLKKAEDLLSVDEIVIRGDRNAIYVRRKVGWPRFTLRNQSRTSPSEKVGF